MKSLSTAARRRRFALRNQGFSLIEVMVSGAVAAVALLALLSSTLAGSDLQQRTAEYGMASRAIRQVHETIRNGDLDDKFDEYVATPDFESGSLDVEVSFPDSVLVDLLAGPIPVNWRYRDMDQDGQVERDDASTANASLLPVQVTVHWEGGDMTSVFLVTEK